MREEIICNLWHCVKLQKSVFSAPNSPPFRKKGTVDYLDALRSEDLI
ncbi:hypothetical protein T4B_8944 [Trichinella pseudospiralis]|uniref:Uncharacterized protein n=1 Tax=Trichinella pseudospiralis TaxID=6337 RepID=A0A0V1IZU3_TRIPS|nr:hypothetical protein T4A_9886 [Trichinella pseudospiralis]KRZ28173.1 hypothetical protein T4B_8944 [Trichinella pseudospiralis]